jgi:tape measure domain-containing protein
LSTISQNNIVVNYVITSDQIAKTKTEFDKLTDAEKKAVDEAKKLSDQLKKTGQEGQESGKKTETSLTKITGPIKQNSAALSAFTSQLKIAGDAATTAANKASAGFAGVEAKQRATTAATNAFRSALISIDPKPIIKVKEASQDAAKELNGFSSIAKSGAGLLAGFFAISSIKEFTQKIFTTTAAFEGLRTTIDYATKGQAKSGEAFQYLTNLANTFGKDLQSLAGTYSSFTASSNLAGIKLNESNKIFEAAVKASSALGKSNQDTQGILLAFSQILSKGTVQAEELRGQIGERIPGAFNLAAKAMGVTTQQLNKMLEQGQVISADFLPKFAVELEKAFGSAAQAKVNSLTASLGRFTTAFDKFLESPLIAKYLAETLNLISVSLDQIRRLTMTEGEKKAEQEAKIESNITNNLKTELAARLKAIQEKTNKNATMDQVVMQKYVETLAFQSKYETEVTNQKIITANSWNKVALTTAQNNLKNTNIVLAALEKEINGYTISNQKKKVLTDEELKALKAQYDAKLKLLEIEKRIADINIEVTTEREDERTLKLLRNAEKFGKDKLAIDREFAALNVKDAENNAKLQTAIVKQQGNDVKVELKKQSDGFRDAEEKYDKEQLEAAKKLEEAKQKARKASMDKSQDDAKEMMKQSEEISKKSIEDEYKRIQKAEEEKAAIRQASFDLAVETTNSLFNIQSQYAANEMARKNKQFDEEIRLADGNVQKITEIEQKRAAAEKEYREKEFRANQLQAVANVVFNTAPIIAKYAAGVVTAPLAIIAAAAAAAQIIAIYAQPLPEFAEGTKGKPFKGRAIVGEKGTEKVVTQSGKVYYTPGVATLAQFDEPVQIIPNNQLGINDKRQLSLIYGSTSRTNDSGGRIIEKLSNIESGLKNMPVAAISLDERGFMKKVRTPNRSTTILNNRFKN